MNRLLLTISFVLMMVCLFSIEIELVDGNTYQLEIVGKQDSAILVKDVYRNIYSKIDFQIIRAITDTLGNNKKDTFYTSKNFEGKINYNNYWSFEKTGMNNRYIEDFLEQASLKENKAYKYKFKLNNLMIGILASALAIDYYDQASDYADQIKANEELELSTSKLERKKSRKNIIGTLFVGAAVYSFVKTYERVEIKVSPQSLNVSYKF